MHPEDPVGKATDMKQALYINHHPCDRESHSAGLTAGRTSLTKCFCCHLVALPQAAVLASGLLTGIAAILRAQSMQLYTCAG